MADINLSKAVRSNLTSLQNTASMMNKTSDRLSTGNKVNSALDNPTNFFTASSLNSRAGDLNNLMDSMANGIKTIEAADNGLKAITKTVETMQSLVRQARADKTSSVTPGTSQAIAMGTTTNAPSATNNKMTVAGAEISVWNATATPAAPQTVDDIAKAINAAVGDKVKASKDADGKLKLENLTTADIEVTGLNATDGISGDTADKITLAKGTETESDVRKSLRLQFNDLRTQLDNLASDASYNGINLLSGDELKLNFNETGSSSTTVQGKNADGSAVGRLDSEALSFASQTDFSSDTTLDALSKTLQTGLSTLRSQASQYGSALSLVQNRQDFTKAMINTLETGAGNLTLADMNQEAANMMALQTRQSLAQSTLSMANQADQGVLQLLR